MKISKFVSVIKNTGRCIVIHMKNEIYLSTGASIYKASEFPEITGSAQIAAVLDVEPKKLKKIAIEEVHSDSRENIYGFDMGCTAGEMEVTSRAYSKFMWKIISQAHPFCMSNDILPDVR